MPRPPLGEKAMTDAERQRKRRERQRQRKTTATKANPLSQELAEALDRRIRALTTENQNLKEMLLQFRYQR
jgi:hypothetical protein